MCLTVGCAVAFWLKVDLVVACLTVYLGESLPLVLPPTCMCCRCGLFRDGTFQTLVPGPCYGPLGSMPRVKAMVVPIRKVQKQHLKLVGLGAISLQRYKVAISKFFAWRKNSGIRPSSSFGQLGDYIDSLYQTEAPGHWAADLLSGMKRFYPRLKSHLKISESFYKNWGKVVSRSRALPLSVKLVRGLFVYGCLKNNPDFSLAVLLGFVMLLRPGEIVALRLSCFTAAGPDLMVVDGQHREDLFELDRLVAVIHSIDNSCYCNRSQILLQAEEDAQNQLLDPFEHSCQEFLSRQ